MTDECQLMILIQQGQLNLLATLFERYKVKLYNYFRRMGHRPAASEDLVQETFMKVLAYRSSFSGSGTFSSWIYGIARNTAVDHYRKNKQQDTYLDIDEQDELVSESLSDTLEKNQQQQLFEQSLASISVEDREIILLSRMQLLKYEEIAQLMDCNVNTLKSKMQAALKRLQTCFNQLTTAQIDKTEVNNG